MYVLQVSEAAVVGFPHAVKGEGIGCFIILRLGVAPTAELAGYVLQYVRYFIYMLFHVCVMIHIL